MSEIKVSVIMPVYNSGEYLSAAIDSILSQSLHEIELILVDDGSTDGSSERCDKYAEKDPRVVVIHQKNGGICAARNAALAIARGKYIGFSDHDDEYSPGQLEDNYNRIEKSGADIIKFGTRTVITHGGKLVRESLRSFDNDLLNNNDLFDRFWELWRAGLLECMWDTLFRKSFLDEHNIRLNTYFKTGSEDYDFLWHCIGEGAIIETNSNIYYNHYIRIGFSTSAKYNPFTVECIKSRIDIMMGYIGDRRKQLENQQTDYTYFWLQMVLGSFCHTIAHPKCKMTNKEKVDAVKSLMSLNSFKSFIQKTPPFAIRKIAAKQYILLLWLFQHGCYRACIKLYEFQYKQR